MEIIYADTFFKRFKGLMGKRDFNNVLVFANLTDSSIHTMFMRFEIDVYFIDENMVVFDKATLKPWRFYKPERQAKYIIETKKGMLELDVNDKIEFI